MRSRLQERYTEEIAGRLRDEFQYANTHQIPSLVKVVMNVGLGEATQNSKLLDKVVEELTAIAGQKAAITRAKKSISNFRLREGQPIGAMVTLRRVRMWEFVDRLLTIALPRVRDFGGVSDKAFDGRGNYTLGLKDQTVFPEIDYDRVEKVTGMNVTIVTTASTDAEAKALLTHLGVPFRK